MRRGWRACPRCSEVIEKDNGCKSTKYVNGLSTRTGSLIVAAANVVSSFARIVFKQGSLASVDSPNRANTIRLSRS